MSAGKPPSAAPAPEPGAPANGSESTPPAASPEAGSFPRELTPEEQLAQFEEALKEDDWGHQPC